MIYSLLVDQAYAGWSAFQQNQDDTPRSLADARKGLDDELAALGEKIAAEPLASFDPVRLTAVYFPTAATVEPERVQVRKPRPGKPDPATWGWQPGDGTMPPGLDP